jgi:peptidoglycan/LPS O-acetylase OafA/YrhL
MAEAAETALGTAPLTEGVARGDERSYFGRIESLRAIGTSLVAGYHFSAMTVHGVQLLPLALPWADPVQHMIGRCLLGANPGHAALMMFFVISGFVLHVSLARGPQEPGRAAGRFLVARLFRFYPIVFFGTTLNLLLLVAGIVVPERSHGFPLSAGELVRNLLLVTASMNITLWALQVELLMAPIIVALFFIERWRGSYLLHTIAVATSALSFSSHWALWPRLSQTVFAFVLGMLVPTFGRRMATSLTNPQATRFVVATVGVLFVSHLFLGMFTRWNALIETYAAVILVSLAAYRADLRLLNFLDSRPLRALGRAAGSYYVLHMSLGFVVTLAAAAIVPAEWMNRVPALLGPAILLLCIAALAPCAVVAHRLIEAPGIELGRRVNQRLGWQRRRQPSAAPAASR